MALNANVVRVAAVADLHCAKAMAAGTFQPLFAQVAERADVLALAGDLTDAGLPEEARLLVRELAVAKVPVVAVFGNHDYEAERQEEVKQILASQAASASARSSRGASRFSSASSARRSTRR